MKTWNGYIIYIFYINKSNETFIYISYVNKKEWK